MKGIRIHVLLADDDVDDCQLFSEALEELGIDADLSIVGDGEQLIHALSKKEQLPHVLFLDLNMPRKNGFECLLEIQSNERTRGIPVIIFSTSFDTDILKLLHKKGARYYIRKPERFESLKKVVRKGLTLASDVSKRDTSFDNFILYP